MIMKWTLPMTVARQAILWASVAVSAAAFVGCRSAAAVLGEDRFAQGYTFTTNRDNTITVSNFAGSAGGITIPSTTNGLPITSIGNYAFFGCTGLTCVTIPSSVTHIGSLAFGGCNLTGIVVIADNPAYRSVDGVLFDKGQTTLIQYPRCKTGGSYAIPGSVTGIASGAFSDCTSLTNVMIGTNVTSIGNWAFSYCTRLTNITIHGSITSIGIYVFYRCNSLMGVYFIGNAPILERVYKFANYDNLFGGTDKATIYYLPGTTGWSNTFGGRPTAIWNMQTNAQGNAQSK